MAKGKRAVALFEVIHRDKRFGPKTAEARKEPAADFSPQMAEKAADLWRKQQFHRRPWSNSTAKVGQSFSALVQRLKSARVAAGALLAGAARDIRTWMVRTNGIAPGAAAALVVIGGMMLARHFMHPVDQASPVELALRAGPAHPSVLAINAERPAPSVPAAPSPEAASDAIQAGDTAPANLAQPGQRVVNMHYVLMQSYFEEKTAEEARDFLNQNGIACTIERGVKGWRPDFYQVIGLQGFPHPSGPEYLAYRHRVEELGLQFSPKSRYKRFVPQAIKW
jgi:hypothetical protein